MRKSKQTVAVLQIFIDGKDRWIYGNELIKTTGLKSGTLYPMLSRLVLRGWLRARYEKIDPRRAKRPPRVYYRITAKGLIEAPLLIDKGE
jgi:PadR family transcriptional regulator PadR